MQSQSLGPVQSRKGQMQDRWPDLSWALGFEDNVGRFCRCALLNGACDASVAVVALPPSGCPLYVSHDELGAEKVQKGCRKGADRCRQVQRNRDPERPYSTE